MAVTIEECTRISMTFEACDQKEAELKAFELIPEAYDGYIPFELNLKPKSKNQWEVSILLRAPDET